jgi:hypothetical protein
MKRGGVFPTKFIFFFKKEFSFGNNLLRQDAYTFLLDKIGFKGLHFPRGFQKPLLKSTRILHLNLSLGKSVTDEKKQAKIE